MFTELNAILETTLTAAREGGRYRVTHHVDSNLPFDIKTKIAF